MVKHLREITQPSDERQLAFKKKHKIDKVADRNGNGDDVFLGKTKEAKYKKQKDDVYEDLDESADSETYDMHHARALKSLTDIGKHLENHKKLTKSNRGHWSIKDAARSLEDMCHNWKQSNEYETPIKKVTN